MIIIALANLVSRLKVGRRCLSGVTLWPSAVTTWKLCRKNMDETSVWCSAVILEVFRKEEEDGGNAVWQPRCKTTACKYSASLMSPQWTAFLSCKEGTEFEFSKNSTSLVFFKPTKKTWFYVLRFLWCNYISYMGHRSLRFINGALLPSL